jgi:hypothetical protein
MLVSNMFWDHLLTKCHALSQRGKSAEFKVRRRVNHCARETARNAYEASDVIVSANTVISKYLTVAANIGRILVVKLVCRYGWGVV